MIFESYSKHEYGAQLRVLSSRLEQRPKILLLFTDDLIDTSLAKVGQTGILNCAISGPASKGIPQN